MDKEPTLLDLVKEQCNGDYSHTSVESALAAIFIPGGFPMKLNLDGTATYDREAHLQAIRDTFDIDDFITVLKEQH